MPVRRRPLVPIVRKKARSWRQRTAVVLKPACFTGKSRILNVSIIQRKSNDVKIQSTTGTFSWLIRPASNRITGTVYTDGSWLGWGKPCTTGTGWAFVILDNGGRIVAAARGKPPSWIGSNTDIEAWALYMAIIHCPLGCSYRTDNKSCVRIFHRGDSIATSNRSTAWIWKHIFNAIRDERQTMDVAWIPAHMKQAQIGKVKLANGELFTANDRRGNAIADAMAKAVAQEHRVQNQICMQEEELERDGGTIKNTAVCLRSFTEAEAIRRRQSGS